LRILEGEVDLTLVPIAKMKQIHALF